MPGLGARAGRVRYALLQKEHAGNRRCHRSANPPRIARPGLRPAFVTTFSASRPRAAGRARQGGSRSWRLGAHSGRRDGPSVDQAGKGDQPDNRAGCANNLADRRNRVFGGQSHVRINVTAPTIMSNSPSNGTAAFRMPDRMRVLVYGRLNRQLIRNRRTIGGEPHVPTLGARAGRVRYAPTSGSEDQGHAETIGTLGGSRFDHRTNV